ncbi:hypothetical protein RRF57_011951 [Xylaria bambusicola]|uniref:Uncharacterized protein n=1 Tax=Xylaria bambusicola TaxID=326684 RepID=A0AAN7V3B9_9PEZI
MPPHRSDRRSRSPGAHAQEPRHSRRRIDEYADASNTDHETSHAQGNVDSQPWGLHGPTWIDDSVAAARSDGLAYSNNVYHGPRLEPEWPTIDTDDHDETLRSGNYYSQVYSDSTWARPAAHRYNPHDHLQYSAAPISSIQADGSPAGFSENACGQTAPTSSSGFQPAQAHTPPARPDWTAWEDPSMDRACRRGLSVRAHQGSAVQPSNFDPYGSPPMYNSTNQHGIAEQNESGESSGEISPVDGIQCIREYMAAKNDPWSTACLRRSPNY